MKEVTGQNIVLADNEVSVVFTDFMDNHRELVLGFNETIPVLPLKQGTCPIISL